MATPTGILGMGKTTPGDNAGWENNLNPALDTLDVISAGANVYHVDKAFTAAALGNGSAADRRHFDTIQGAINAAQGAGYTRKAVIEIAPDDYYERLLINNSITLLGKVPVNYYGMGGARGAEIHGDGSQNPVITIVPPAGGNIAVNLEQLNLENCYAGQAAYINKPYLVDFRSDNAIGQVNYFGMLDCAVRGQTWGQDNDWECMIALAGYLRSTFEGRNIWSAGYYAGGHLNGGIRKFLKLRGVYTGVPANDKTSWAQIHGARLFQTYLGAGAATIFDCDSGSGGRLARSDVYRNVGSLAVYGSQGVNSAIEGAGLDFQTLGNIQAMTYTF